MFNITSNLSTYDSFNQPDVNFNGQVVNWATGSPIYDASLNGSAHVSSQNYKTGNGSLEMAKNTFSTQSWTSATVRNSEEYSEMQVIKHIW